ncbi:MAG: S9 family peptidase, partial [Pseudomonadota bacterium]
MPHFPALPDAPIATRRPAQASHHGVTLHDDYGWLRADNWQEAMREPDKLPSDIAAYLKAENAYFDAAMAETAGLQDTLIAEMRGRIKEDDDSVPRPHGPYLYTRRYAAGDEHPRYLRSPREGGAEEVLIDVNAAAAAHDYFQLGALAVSPGHRLLAWSADTNGSEFYQLRLRDLSKGDDMAEVIADVSSVAWADEDTLFYVRVNANHRPDKVYRHRLGTDPAGDVLVYAETDERYFVGISRMPSGAFIAIATGMNDESEVHVIPTDAPETAPRVIAPRRTGIEYSVAHQGDDFLILTNDGALDFQIMRAPVG